MRERERHNRVSLVAQLSVPAAEPVFLADLGKTKTRPRAVATPPARPPALA
jgi:hypothetical protein